MSHRASEGILSTASSRVPAAHRRDGGAAWPAAVLWDLDGTLVDTEPYWFDVEHEIARAYGGTWSHEHALRLVGSDLRTSGAYLQRHLAIDVSVDAIVKMLVDGVVARMEQDLPLRPGALGLLAELRTAAVPCGLVTMSYAPVVAAVLRSLPDGTFDAIVTGDAVTHGKPHPEPYLTAAAMLGVAAGDCLAIEDSEPGASSAEAAGCTVLVVPNQVAVRPGARRTFADTLAGLDLRLVWADRPGDDGRPRPAYSSRSRPR